MHVEQKHKMSGNDQPRINFFFFKLLNNCVSILRKLMTGTLLREQQRSALWKG